MPKPKPTTSIPKMTSQVSQKLSRNLGHQNPPNHGHPRKCHGESKVLTSNGGFKSYKSCEDGILVTKKCPRNSIFYFAIQCCVAISDFPCKANCIRDRRKVMKQNHDYAYFHY